MVQFNFSERTIKAKVVYYGPPQSGKTTNLEWIHRKLAPDKRGKLIASGSDALFRVAKVLDPFQSDGQRVIPITQLAAFGKVNGLDVQRFHGVFTGTRYISLPIMQLILDLELVSCHESAVSQPEIPVIGSIRLVVILGAYVGVLDLRQRV